LWDGQLYYAAYAISHCEDPQAGEIFNQDIMWQCTGISSSFGMKTERDKLLGLAWSFRLATPTMK
jgi:hypothetical protein